MGTLDDLAAAKRTPAPARQPTPVYLDAETRADLKRIRRAIVWIEFFVCLIGLMVLLGSIGFAVKFVPR